MDQFKKTFKQTLDNISGVSGTIESALYSENVQKAVDGAINALQHEAVHRVNVSEDYLKGWLAEQWHAETLKVSGAARGRSDLWSTVSGDNGPGDIKYGDAHSAIEAQVKFFKTGEDTAKAVSRPDYEGMEKIVPADQLETVKKAAERLAHKNHINRLAQAKHYQDTADHSSDQLNCGNAHSEPLSESHSKEMAKDFKKDSDIDPDKFGLNTESFVEWSDIARQSGEAALHAAALSAAISAAPHIWATVKEYVDTGEIDICALAERGQSVLLSAGTAGLRGGVAAGLTAACKTGLMGNALKGISPAAIGMATTITLNAISYSIRLQQGDISSQEFAHHCLRDTFVLTSGMCGAAVGQLVIPIPVLGALVGNLVGSTLGAVVFEGTNQVVLGICVESGWTFFGLVNQEYVVSDEVLRIAGYDIFSTHSFSKESFATQSFSIQSFKVNSLSFSTISRGVISCNTIGYF